MQKNDQLCGCCGKGTTNPHLLRLMEIIETAEEKRKADESAGLKLEPPEQPQRRRAV